MVAQKDQDIVKVGTVGAVVARLERGEVGMVESLQDLSEQLLALEKVANVLTPISGAQTLMPLHAVSLRVVRIDPNPVAGEVYFDPRFCDKDDKGQPTSVALAGGALNKLCQAAGVHTDESRRTDDRSDPYYCEHTVALRMRDYDGNIRQSRGTKQCDFRDDSPALLKGNGQRRSPSQIAEMRTHIGSLAETKARFRALRPLLVLKQKYRVADVARPWVVPVLVVRPDPSNPMDRAWILNSGQVAARALYGATDDGEVTREVKDVTPSHSNPPPESTESKPDSDIPEDEDLDYRAVDPDDPPEPVLVCGCPPEPVLVCGCPCGCKAVLSEAAYAAGVRQIETPRCKGCYPGSGFQFHSLHAPSLDLQIPKYPGMTAGKLMEILERQGGQK
jgi:hypothetical protein